MIFGKPLMLRVSLLRVSCARFFTVGGLIDYVFVCMHGHVKDRKNERCPWRLCNALH